MLSIHAFLWLAAGAALAACGSSGLPAGAGSSPELAVDSKGCTRFGDPPQPLTHSVDGNAPGLACGALKGEMLAWTDPEGTPRSACLVAPPGATLQAPLPLLVWLHPSEFTEDAILSTNLPQQIAVANLSGDPARPGFILLLPRGRDTHHELPAPDDSGWGWDNWYRNFDRGSPLLNVDAAAIDQFVAVAKARGIVDARRVYVSGWSNGANMAMLYGMNTPGVAATAVYSGTTPFEDPADPCPQVPFAGNPRPLYVVQHDCDIGGACQAAVKDLARLNDVIPAIHIEHRIIDAAQQNVAACDAMCDAGQPLSLSLGGANHLQWPQFKTDELLGFLRDHPSQ